MAKMDLSSRRPAGSIGGKKSELTFGPVFKYFQKVNDMKKIQRGFTLIELVMVIVILGVLAAVAIPKFVDLSAEAGNAATKGVAGAISSATSVNYAAKAIGKAGAATLNDTNINTCKTAVLQPLLSGITLTDGTIATTDTSTYNVSVGTGSPTTCVGSPGVATTCTVIGSKGVAQQATVICTGP
ncbi:pilin [Rhodoferax sp.]